MSKNKIKFYGVIWNIVISYKIAICIDIAINKDCRQSSLDAQRHPHLATDGTINQNDYNQCTHTSSSDKSAWWAVDLGDIFHITDVEIWGRSDCCQFRLSKFYIEAIKPYNSWPCSNYSLGNWQTFDTGEVSECYYKDTPTQYLSAHCQPGTSGQFIRIRQTNQEPLTLCEVKVFGNKVNPKYLGRGHPKKCGFVGHRYEGTLLDTSHKRSLLLCVAHCMNFGCCYSSNFRPDGNECVLMAKIPGEYYEHLAFNTNWIVHFNP